jgi:hemerythrin-like domain-containing protein
MNPSDTVMNYLADDHDRLDALLGDAARLVEAGEDAAAGVQLAAFVAGLTRHIRLEDEVLFPRFERATGMTSGPTTVMRREHRLIEKVLTGLTAAVEARDRTAFAALHDELLAILEPHNQKEEAVIYPMTDQALDDETRRKFVAELRAYV